MNISILCSDKHHPVVKRLRQWADSMTGNGHAVSLLFDKAELPGGELLFLVSCTQLIREEERKRYRATLVLHASDLPKRRGWSPHVWSILDHEARITVSLLEAREPVDSGPVWLKAVFDLEGHELLPEINAKLFDTEIALMARAVDEFETITPVLQSGDPGPYMQRRTAADSRLDPNKTIAEQFDLLRVVDSDRYPAFLDFRGARFLIKIMKHDNDQ